MESNPVIEIFSGTLWEAEMIRNLLLEEDIESFLKNDVVQSYAYEPVFAGEVKVMILSSDYVRASEIVQQYLANLKK